MTIVTFLVVEFRFSIYLMWSQFGDTCTCSALVLKLQTVQTRGAAVIKARKLSSAMSAAKAICDHLRDVWFGTKPVCCCKAIIYHLRTYVWHSIVTADFFVMTDVYAYMTGRVGVDGCGVGRLLRHSEGHHLQRTGYHRPGSQLENCPGTHSIFS